MEGHGASSVGFWRGLVSCLADGPLLPVSSRDLFCVLEHSWYLPSVRTLSY